MVLGGRVIDPESGLDDRRHLGIRGDRIRYVGPEAPRGRDTVRADGMVVAPGFIDLHRHAHGEHSYRLQALDGVTSSFETEIGAADIDGWLDMWAPGQLVNHGVAAGHIGARMAILGDDGFMLPTGPGRGPATGSEIDRIVGGVEAGLEAGAVAVGMGLAYTPGATPAEVERVFEAAARAGASVHVHLEGGIEGLREVLDMAQRTGAAVHVAHVNSTAGPAVARYLTEIRAARERGVDATTEVYPYTAGATLIQSALFDDWESWPDEAFERFQWAATGERLDRASFGRYREQGGSVISHSNTEEHLHIGISDPLPVFASDGGRDAQDRPTHPRAAGTFSRILGRYVRDEGLIDLPDAIRRMTLEPARRLESRVPEMGDRGRLRDGAYADVVVFDPARIIDRATYLDPDQPSEGVVHLLVNGTIVVRDGELVSPAPRPGRAIRAPVRH